MGTRLALRIQDRFEALTPSEQKLAALLLDRPDEILSFSATELAALAGVSKATAARFFRNLGYADFNDVRLQAREERNRTGPVQLVPMPADRLEGAATIPIHLQVEMANLTRTFEELRSEGLEDRLLLVHANDSEFPLGEHRDRHTNIGEGHIGVEGFRAILAESAVRNAAAALVETPGDVEAHRRDIETLRGLVGEAI